jgi:hypothetical protein
MKTPRQRKAYELLRANPQADGEPLSYWLKRVATEEFTYYALHALYHSCIKHLSDYSPNVGQDVKKLLNFSPIPPMDATELKTETQGYKPEPVILSAFDGKKIMTLQEYCEHWNLPTEDVHSAKLVTHTGTPYWNIAFKERTAVAISEEYIDLLLERSVRKYILPLPPVPVEAGSVSMASRLVFSDVHVGMDPDPDGTSPFGGEWGTADIQGRFMHMLEFTLQHATGDTIYVDDLGDFLDGWDSYTVRRDHRLEQNMDNETAFDVALELKMFLIENLANRFRSVIVNNVCNDNHAGSFAYVVNSALKKILEAKHRNVSVTNHRSFMGHYKIFDKAFILCHGKDEKFMKAGMGVDVKPQNIEKVDQYIKLHGLYNGTSRIVFCKGDDHQCVFNLASSDDFDYMSYPAFSPSSSYIQTNFKRGRSGFVLETVREDSNTIEQKIEWFKWEK